MKTLVPKPRADGKTFLHNWRTGRIYLEKNRPLMLRDWTNLQHRHYCHHRLRDGVLVHDCRRGIPAPDSSFDVIYSCHVIEHLTTDEAEAFLRELWRVLKPGGVCRISTPDLESESREYLRQLEQCAVDPSEVNDRRYELAVRGLIDQFVRHRGGGELVKHFRSEHLDRAYALEHYGDVYREFIPELSRQLPDAKPVPLGQKLRAATWGQLVDLLKLRLIKRLTKGHPLFTGENERWEWDFHSLGKAYRLAGFGQVTRQSFDSSAIPDWKLYQFDTSFDGRTPIERSLYLEAEKAQ